MPITIEQSMVGQSEAWLKNQSELRRMAWRCRRGMLELDLLFTPFVQDYLAGLNHAQIVALDALLDMPDNLLWALLADNNNGLADAASNQVLAMLRH